MKTATVCKAKDEMKYGSHGHTATSEIGEGHEMIGDVCDDDFEQRLIEHVEVLYLVAMNLTRDGDAAEFITHGALSEAWNNRSVLKNKPLKSELLKLLRRKFHEYRGIVGLRRTLSSSSFNGPDFEEAPCDISGHGRIEFATMS